MKPLHQFLSKLNVDAATTEDTTTVTATSDNTLSDLPSLSDDGVGVGVGDDTLPVVASSPVKWPPKKPNLPYHQKYPLTTAMKGSSSPGEFQKQSLRVNFASVLSSVGAKLDIDNDSEGEVPAVVRELGVSASQGKLSLLQDEAVVSPSNGTRDGIDVISVKTRRMRGLRVSTTAPLGDHVTQPVSHQEEEEEEQTIGSATSQDGHVTRRTASQDHMIHSSSHPVVSSQEHHVIRVTTHEDHVTSPQDHVIHPVSAEAASQEDNVICVTPQEDHMTSQEETHIPVVPQEDHVIHPEDHVIHSDTDPSPPPPPPPQDLPDGSTHHRPAGGVNFGLIRAANGDK